MNIDDIRNKYVSLSNSIISFGKILEKSLKNKESAEGFNKLADIIIQEAHALYLSTSLNNEKD